ncbi:unnamed protein product [Thlaspi arvense]|uniref:Uncharacterized protein n=1 Tax=Thlaspi arvense TaxID=13288 RepID=A0AAU9S3Q4_THLAR|nr:unnamed protein product [Thlaspi arvense]
MASCSLGVPKIKISAVDLSRVRSGSLQTIPCNQRSMICQRPLKYLSLRTTLCSVKAVQVSAVTAAETSDTVEVEDTEETKSYPLNAQLIPKPSEVEALVTEICDSSSIAEFELKVGFFRRSKTIKGKRTPSSCKEKDQVKEGQVLCYIEQLGGQFPIESPSDTMMLSSRSFPPSLGSRSFSNTIF